MENYRPAPILVLFVKLTMFGTALFTLALSILEVYGVSEFPDFSDPTAEISSGAEALVVGASFLGTLGMLATMIASIILFLVWIRRANRNARALKAEGMQFSPGACIGWWFLPIANLVKPYQAVKEIYQASGPGDGADWPSTPVPGFVSAWWGSWIVANVMSGFQFRLADTIDPTRSAWLGVLVGLVLLICAIRASQVVRAVHQRQEERSISLSAPSIAPS